MKGGLRADEFTPIPPPTSEYTAPRIPPAPQSLSQSAPRCTLPPVKPPPPKSHPQSLDELMLIAADFADFTLRHYPQILPTIILATRQGTRIFSPGAVNGEEAKDSFAETCQWLCLACEATAVVLILESWMKLAPKDGPLDLTERPSEAIDRVEVVFLSGEAIGVHRARIMKIIRTDAGGFFGLTELEQIAGADFQGRFAQVMPSAPPTPQIVAVAKALLGAKGMKETKAPPPRENRRW